MTNAQYGETNAVFRRACELASQQQKEATDAQS